MHIGENTEITKIGYAPLELYNTLNEMKIELNSPDVSDVIVLMKSASENNAFYANLMTGKQGKNYTDVVREDRRFIFFNRYGTSTDELDLNGGLGGLYFRYIEEHDVVVGVLCNLERGENGIYRWVENTSAKPVRRVYISKKYRFIEKRILRYINSSIVDICGQTAIPFDNCVAAHAELQSGSSHNAPVGIQRVLIDYFGGCVGFFSTDIYNEDKYYFQTMEDIRTFIVNIIKEYMDNYGYLSSGIDYEKGLYTNFPEKIPDIPEEAIKRMETLTRTVIYTLTIGIPPRRKPEDVSFVCLQNVNGEVVHRMFVPIIGLHNSAEKTTIEMVEFRRTVINEDLFQTAMKKYIPVDGIPVWCDEDFKGTPFEFTVEPIREYIELLDDFIKKPDFRLYSAMLNLGREKGYFVTAGFLVKIAYELGTNKTLERLFKSMKTNLPKKYLTNQLTYCNAKEFLFRNFGSIDEGKKSLNRVLGISKEMLEQLLVGKFDGAGTLYIKYVFKGSSPSDYLVSMNKEDSCLLISYAKTAMEDELSEIEPKEQTIKRLIHMYGYGNWKNYFEFFYKKLPESDEGAYMAYIELLEKLGVASKHIDWKLTGENLLKSYKSLVIADYALNGDNNEYYVKKFKNRERHWKEMEYENDDYFITYPKAPMDLVIEGLYLKHCAKEFVEAVALGETEIYFIRKKSEPDTPFYTLEIRGYTVRQVHGFNNCSVSKERDVLYFLKEFAAAKDIEFDVDEANCLLGPNDDNDYDDDWEDEFIEDEYDEYGDEEY